MDKIKTAKKNLYKMGVENSGKEETIKGLKKAFGGRKSPISKAISKAKGEEKLEKASKKAGWYVHGHKNYGDVYEA